MVYGTRRLSSKAAQALSGSGDSMLAPSQHLAAESSNHVLEVVDVDATPTPSIAASQPIKALESSPPAQEKAPGITECVICLDDICNAPFTGTLPKCNHVFCFTCIQNWSKQETTCPLCKLEFTTISKMVGELASAAASTHGTGPGATSFSNTGTRGAGRKRKAAADPKPKSVKVKKTTQADYYHRRMQNAIQHEADFLMQMFMNTFQLPPTGFSAALGAGGGGGGGGGGGSGSAGERLTVPFGLDALLFGMGAGAGGGGGMGAFGAELMQLLAAGAFGGRGGSSPSPTPSPGPSSPDSDVFFSSSSSSRPGHRSTRAGAGSMSNRSGGRNPSFRDATMELSSMNHDSREQPHLRALRQRWSPGLGLTQNLTSTSRSDGAGSSSLNPIALLDDNESDDDDTPPLIALYPRASQSQTAAAAAAAVSASTSLNSATTIGSGDTRTGAGDSGISSSSSSSPRPSASAGAGAGRNGTVHDAAVRGEGLSIPPVTVTSEAPVSLLLHSSSSSSSTSSSSSSSSGGGDSTTSMNGNSSTTTTVNANGTTTMTRQLHIREEESLCT